MFADFGMVVFASVQNVVHDWQHILGVTRPRRMMAGQIDLQLEEDIGIGAEARPQPTLETLGGATIRAMMDQKLAKNLRFVSVLPTRPSVPNPKFALLLSKHFCELRVQRDTRIIELLVSL
jgi:hypothetical protein